MQNRAIKGWEKGDFSSTNPDNFYQYCSDNNLGSLFALSMEELEKPNLLNVMGTKTLGYKNLSFSEKIIEIGVSRNEDLSRYALGSSATLVHLRAAPSTYTSLCQDCEAVKFVQAEYQCQSDRQIVTIIFKDDLSVFPLTKLLELFSNINHNEKNEALPTALIEELVAFIKSPVKLNHAIENQDNEFYNLRPTTKSHVNPVRADSKQLIELVKNYAGNNFPLIQFNKELIRGSDPNQTGEGNVPTIILLICKSHHYSAEEFKKLILLLLAYGANPFRRYESCLLYTSAYDILYYQNKTDILDLVISAGTIPQKSLSTSKSNQVLTFGADKNVMTIFKSPIGKIVVTKYLENLTAHEYAVLKKLYFSEFNASEDAFKTYFTGINKIVDLIYFKNGLIGFNLYKLTKINNTHLVTYWCSSLKKEHRGIDKTMDFLKLRLALATYLLNPDDATACFYDAITFGGHNAGHQQLYLPKYDPQFDKPEAAIPLQKIVSQEYETELKTDDGLYPYIDEEVTVVNIKQNPKKAHVQRDFFQEILQNGHPNRSVTVFFYVSMQMFLESREVFEKSIGMDFFKQCYLFALELGKPINKKPLKVPAFPDCYALFWKGKKTFLMQDHNHQPYYHLPSNG